MPALRRIVPDGGGADLVAEAGELAMDTSVAPGRVLCRQPDSEGAETCRDSGSTGWRWNGGPVLGGESPVPAQDGGGRDEQPETPAQRKQSGQGCHEGSVGPAHPGARSASLEDCELVTQDQDFDLLRGVRSGEQNHPRQDSGERQVDQPQRHGWIMSNSGRATTCRSAAVTLVSGTHRPVLPQRARRAASGPRPGRRALGGAEREHGRPATAAGDRQPAACLSPDPQPPNAPATGAVVMVVPG